MSCSVYKFQEGKFAQDLLTPRAVLENLMNACAVLPLLSVVLSCVNQQHCTNAVLSLSWKSQMSSPSVDSQSETFLSEFKSVMRLLELTNMPENERLLLSQKLLSLRQYDRSVIEQAFVKLSNDKSLRRHDARMKAYTAGLLLMLIKTDNPSSKEMQRLRNIFWERNTKPFDSRWPWVESNGCWSLEPFNVLEWGARDTRLERLLSVLAKK